LTLLIGTDLFSM